MAKRMEKKLGLKREKGRLYFLSKTGDVMSAPMKRKKAKKKK